MQIPQFLLFLVLFTAAANTSEVFGRNIYANQDNSKSNEKNVVNKSRIASTITVDQHGRGDFKTIQAAIDSIPSGNTDWVKIIISAGEYTEKVTITRDKPYVFLEGQGLEQTVITYNAHESTNSSATFTSSPDNVVASGISFKNSYNRAFHESPDDEIKQAVAARIYGDKSAFIECGFIGFQDTLWDASGRHYFKNCYIEGAIDFIFGSGLSFYENSLINATVGTQPQTSGGYITAQGRESLEDKNGFVFEGGSVFGSGQVYLGRAYRAYSTVIFHATHLGSVVDPKGWDAWTYKGQESSLTYAEVNCTGPGSNTSERVPWEKHISSQEAAEKYSRSSFIDQDKWISTLPL